MGSTRMNKLLQAIVDEDTSTAERLLQGDARLATCLIRTEKLYHSGIFHWIYVGDTALHLAAAGYRVEIVRLLLAAGADPNAMKNRRKSTPLHYGADGFINGPAWEPKRQVDTIRCLCKSGADIHAQDRNGATPLHRAVRTRCAAVVAFLLKAGSDPTIPNKSGSTAFHLAVQNTGRGGTGIPAAITSQREIIQTFLSFGISPTLTNTRGKTVADCVQSEWIQDLFRGVG